MKRFLKYKYTLYGILSDVIIISSVVFFNSNIGRILGFYWLDTCVMILFYMLYWKWIGRLKYYFQLLFMIAVLIMINTMYFPIVFNVAGMLNYDVSFESFYAIFYPYYDVAFFITVSATSHYQFFSKARELAFKGIDVEYLTNMSSVLSIFILPWAIVVGGVIMLLIPNPAISILLGFIFLRDRLDYWKYKQLNAFSEASLTAAEEDIVLKKNM